MMTLWILSCRMTEQWDTLFTFYARDHEQAEQKAAAILEEHPSYERLALKTSPCGFTIIQTHLAGTIEEERME